MNELMFLILLMNMNVFYFYYKMIFFIYESYYDVTLYDIQPTML